MKKLNQLTMLIAAVVFASAAGAQSIDNWRARDNTVVKNGTSELCWRNNSWTPATAAADCDGAIVAKAPEPAPVAVVEAPAPEPAPAPAPAPVVTASKVNYAADALFDFDKAIIKPEGKAQLDDLIAKIKDIDLEVVVAVGHTDATGPAQYNQALSLKRAEAVKAYLVSNGIDQERVYAEGKGETSPIASNANKEGRAKNRRVEIEVVGSRNN